MSSKTNRYGSQAHTARQLREGHAFKLILAAETLNAMMSVVTVYVSAKILHRQVIKDLCKNKFSCVHNETRAKNLRA